MVSVVMATYNGDQLIRSQIDSILTQLKMNDELIISDDGSNDGTWKILQEYKASDLRVRILKGPGLGVIKNFEYALTKVSGEIVFLSDQDDIWLPNKIHTIIRHFIEQPSNILLIMHNGIETNINGLVLKNEYKMRHGVLRNIIKSSYYGHRMAFKVGLLPYILPFPQICPSYDQYIGLVCEHKKCSVFIPDKLTNHIIHNNNWSQKLTLAKQIIFRCMMGLSLLKYFQKLVFQMNLNRTSWIGKNE